MVWSLGAADGSAGVAFSGQDPRWHVVIEGTVLPPGEAALIEVLVARIAAAAGIEVTVAEL